MATKSIATSSVNAAVVNVVNLLQEAESVAPRGNNFRKTQRVITWDSMQAMLRRNDLKGDVKAAAEQAFYTLASRQVNGERSKQGLPSIAITPKNVDEFYIKVNATAWRSLENTLKGFFKTHNKSTPKTLEPTEQKKLGKTAKKVLAAEDELKKIKFSKIQGNKEQSKMVNTVLDVLFNRAGVADSGRVSAGEIAEYFKTRGKGQSKAFKNATWATFNYLRQAMRHEGWGWQAGQQPPRDSMCIDEGERAAQKLMALKPGGDTYDAIAKAAKEA